MADSSNQPVIITNAFDTATDGPSGMHSDMPVSQQPPNTYRNAWNVSTQSNDERGGGLFNKQSNEEYISVPEGHIVRGLHYVEERNTHLIFSCNGSFSEIGQVFNGEYKKLFNDDDLEDGCVLGFGLGEWIPIESKYIKAGNCYHLHLYWSCGTYYYTLNIDNIKAIDLPMSCDDIFLFKCHGSGAPEVFVSETGGYNLPAGAYQYAVQFEDEDGNTTNYYNISHPVSLAGETGVAGEKTRCAVHIQLRNLHPEYSKINIACIQTVGGATTQYIVAQVYYSNDAVEYIHRNVEQTLGDLDPKEIRVKKNGWIRGYDLIQYESTLMLYNVIGETNPDLQKHFDKVKVSYIIEGVPLKYAHLHSGMRADENYALSACVNFCDNTSTRDFTLKGRKSNASDLVDADSEENCTDCKAAEWQVRSTAVQTESYCDDVWDVAGNADEIDINTGTPVYEENPKPDDPLGPDDAGGIPNEQDIKNTQKRQAEMMECTCIGLAEVFGLFNFYKRSGVLGVNFVIHPHHRELLSDPVAIVSMMCACEDARRQAEDPCNDVNCDTCCESCNDTGGDDLDVRTTGEESAECKQCKECCGSC